MSNPRLKICILGANGQVGTEVCVFLDEMKEVEVIPVARTPYGSSILRRLGLKCLHGDPATSEEVRKTIGECDLVADFSLPRGSPRQIADVTQTRLQTILPEMASGGHFVFVSTMAVFHLNPRAPRFQIYGHTKRAGERLAMKLGRKRGRSVSVLRLGQVHGVSQSCSKAIRAFVTEGPVAVPPFTSFTVFTYTIAEALINLARKLDPPDVYTLTSVPGWTWREVHEFYCREAGAMPPEIRVETAEIRRRWRDVIPVKQWLGSAIYANRELVETIVSALDEDLATRLRARHYRQKAAGELRRLAEKPVFRPYVQWKEVPGRRMSSLSDSRRSMMPVYARVRARFEALERGFAAAGSKE